MANSMSDRSRATRARTAAAWNKRKLESGELKQVRANIKADLHARIMKIKDTTGESWPELLERWVTEDERRRK